MLPASPLMEIEPPTQAFSKRSFEFLMNMMTNYKGQKGHCPALSTTQNVNENPVGDVTHPEHFDEALEAARLMTSHTWSISMRPWRQPG